MRATGLENEAMDWVAIRKTAPGAIGRWTRFGVGLVAVLLFAFVVIPWLQSIGPVREMNKTRTRDIEATGLFYTEVEETAEAEMFIRNSMEQGPGRKQ